MLHLLVHGVRYLGAAVADVGQPHAGEYVDVLAALDVGDPDALAVSDDVKAVRLVEVCDLLGVGPEVVTGHLPKFIEVSGHLLLLRLLACGGDRRFSSPM